MNYLRLALDKSSENKVSDQDNCNNSAGDLYILIIEERCLIFLRQIILPLIPFLPGS